MAIIFSTYLSLIEGIDATDPKVQRSLQKTLAAGQAYAGEPFPKANDPEVENIHLAAACVGKKPACVMMTNMLTDHPDEVARIVTHELLSHGRRVRPDFTVMPMSIPGFMNNWSLIGGKDAVHELHDLLRMQYEMSVQMAPELASMSDDEKRQHVADIIRGSKKCGQGGESGWTCAPLHRRIGQLFGYDPSSIEQHVGGMPLQHVPNLPMYTKVAPSMQPHLGPQASLGPEKQEWYDSYLHMLIYEGFIYIPGVSKTLK